MVGERASIAYWTDISLVGLNTFRIRHDRRDVTASMISESQSFPDHTGRPIIALRSFNRGSPSSVRSYGCLALAHLACTPSNITPVTASTALFIVVLRGTSTSIRPCVSPPDEHILESVTFSWWPNTFRTPSMRSRSPFSNPDCHGIFRQAMKSLIRQRSEAV